MNKKITVSKNKVSAEKKRSEAMKISSSAHKKTLISTEKLSARMKKAASTFSFAAKKKDGVSEWLTDNYFILQRRAVQTCGECRRVERSERGSELLPGLFDKCCDICADNKLPDDEKIISLFSEKGLSLGESELLPLAVICVLIEGAARAARCFGSDKNSDVLLSNAIKSIRAYEKTDFEYIISQVCEAEKILLTEPEGIYRSMDEPSKSVYRKAIISKCEEKNISETEFIRKTLQKAEEAGVHFGKYILNGKRSKAYGYSCIAVEFLLSAAVSVCAAVIFKSVAAGVLIFFPLKQFIGGVVNSSALKKIPPSRFLRLKRDDEKVMNCDTLIVLSTLLPPSDKTHELRSRLTDLYLSNCTGKIKVCCLADFKSSNEPSLPEDKLDFKAMKEITDELNEKFGGGFVFAIRPRAYSETQNEFTGEERKRGAITALIKAIKGDESRFDVICGDKDGLENVKYIIAVDQDTVLPFDAARELISVAEHPLNRPVISRKKGRVVEGYGVIVPASENKTNANGSYFSLLMASGGGINSYSSVVNERYQDLFGEGIFCGKGLIDVDSYACLLCENMPKERILSHDIVEGGYLRAGFASDIKVTEGFPQSVSTYFQRLHRWVRGDWQNIPFIFGKNPLNFISKYKLFDNVLRSLNSFFCVFAILISCLFDKNIGSFVAAVSLVSLVAPQLFAGAEALIRNGFGALTRLSFSSAMPPALSALTRAFCTVALSVHESAKCVDAAVRACWRMLVSKKHLLDWTTFANSKSNKNLLSLLAMSLPSIVVSVVTFVFGTPVHRLFAVIVLFDVPLTVFGGKRRKKEDEKLSEADRETLRSYAGAIWGFFNDKCSKENNFLPPDNISFSPVRSVAKRTSPTNIGLMLVSFLAARDMDFLTSRELFERLEKSFESIDKLEKFEGNLLNWYSTETLEPLFPKFVSTVDSGNFICCLVALKEGLKEYISECSELKKIISQCENIISETGLDQLYDNRKKLFYIGLDPQTGKKSESFYDLQMSESTLTSYYAVAKRVVPVTHWSARSRILVKLGRYSGLASWTGTMFEYFMPYLFLPFPKGSMLHESLRFCLYCQKKRAETRPFGVSESGFFAFDGNMNYQYKAHGVQKTGLRKGLDDEYVVSPYSSFLTLTMSPSDSLKNLARLKKEGAFGKYGFYEAVDYTKKRTNGKHEVVCSFMSHHMGMSFIALDNMLNKNIFQKRFMRDFEMRGAKSLLDEKIPIGEPVFEDINRKTVPEVRSRVRSKAFKTDSPSPATPNAAVYSNGRMTLCISDVGTSFTRLNGSEITVSSEDTIEKPMGIFGVFSYENKRIPFIKAIDAENSAKYSAQFRKNYTEHSAVTSHLKLKMKTCILQKYDCEIRRFTIENLNKKKEISGKLTVYFEPCLTDRESFASHPAFSRIFICNEVKKDENCVLFARKSRGESYKTALAAGFPKSVKASFDLLRETALKSPFGVFSIGKSEVSCEKSYPDCCFCADIEVKLRSGESKSYDLILSAAEAPETAFDTFRMVRTGKFEEERADDPFFNDAVLNSLSRCVVPNVVYGKNFVKKAVGKLSENRIEDIWSVGISADLPMVLLEVSSIDDAELITPYIRINKCLRNCGILSDLIIFVDENDGYSEPVFSKIKKIISDEGCELMIGVKGGVHLKNKKKMMPRSIEAIRENAVMRVDVEKGPDERKNTAFSPTPNHTVKLFDDLPNLSQCVKRYNFTSGKIMIKNNLKSLDIPWNLVLSGKSLGTMVSDKALGFTWALNSRENKLTPWFNDSCSDNCGERLIFKINGEIFDIIALADTVFMPDKACWMCETNGLRIYVKVEVSEVGMCKKCSVKIENFSSSEMRFDMMYYALPVLGVRREKCGLFSCKKTECGALASNPFSEFEGVMYLSCSSPVDHHCFSRADFFAGVFDSDEYMPCDGCLSVGKKVDLKSGESLVTDFFLSWGATESAALKMSGISSFRTNIVIPEFSLENKKLKLFSESFLYSQVKQCRFLAKTGPHQCSGAFGFRDQLQDCLSLISTDPKLVRTHLLRCAAVQFEQGDVLHWWHIVVNKRQIIRGVRTRCSDDMLWLPYLCGEYVEQSGDKDVLKVFVPFITAEMLSEGEKERYFTVDRSKNKANLFEHCVRAVEVSSKKGSHGLPLIGSCDWNDGFSNLSNDGDAESVWLAMFRIVVLKKMIGLCKLMNAEHLAQTYRKEIKALKTAVEKHAWAGDKYIRAFKSDGEPLGGTEFTDILPQAFSVFAELDDKRSDVALTTAYKKLFDKENRVIRLFSEPFTENDLESVGYIAAYPEGIRENSGQYTHAAIWLALAMLQKGRKNEAGELLSAIDPAEKYDSDEIARRYRAEPYVLAADVAHGGEISGRAGWTHFTGSASWLLHLLQMYGSEL